MEIVIIAIELSTQIITINNVSSSSSFSTGGIFKLRLLLVLFKLIYFDIEKCKHYS